MLLKCPRVLSGWIGTHHWLDMHKNTPTLKWSSDHMHTNRPVSCLFCFFGSRLGCLQFQAVNVLLPDFSGLLTLISTSFYHCVEAREYSRLAKNLQEPTNSRQLAAFHECN